MKRTYNQLSQETENRIVEAYRNGEPSTKIAKREKVTPSTVLKYVAQHGIARSLSDAKRKYTLNQKFFEEIDSKEKAYWLGFLYADGHVSKRSDIILALCMSDVEHVKLFAESIQSDMPVKHVFTKTNFGPSCIARIDIRSIKMAEDLKKHGVDNEKSKKFHIKNIPLDLLDFFWLGVLDGDGCFYVSKNKYETFSLELVGNYEEIEAFYQHFLGETKRIPIKHKSIFKGSVSGNKILAKMKTLYEMSPVFLKRKKEKLFEILSNKP